VAVIGLFTWKGGVDVGIWFAATWLSGGFGAWIWVTEDRIADRDGWVRDLRRLEGLQREIHVLTLRQSCGACRSSTVGVCEQHK